MSDILTRLNELARNDELDAEIARCEAQRDDLNDTIASLKRFKAHLAKDFGPPEPKPRKRAVKRGRPRSTAPMARSGVSSQRLVAIADAMQAYKMPFSQGDVVQATGISTGPISQAFKTLNELEFIGKSGTRPAKQGKPVVLWQVKDAHALDTLRAKLAHDERV